MSENQHTCDAPQSQPIPNRLAFHNLTGKRFCRLAVLYYVGQRGKQGAFWVCKCDCGNVRIVASHKLMSKHTKSCGCLQKEKATERNTSHGGSKQPVYAVWCAMKRRCYNTSDKNYHQYGGRGITVCREWRDSFRTFIEDMGQPPVGCQLDRKDNDKGYDADNKCTRFNEIHH